MEYKVIENPSEYIGKKVHVEGWNPGGVFILHSYEDGTAVLKTRATSRQYATKNRLLKLRKDQ